MHRLIPVFAALLVFCFAVDCFACGRARRAAGKAVNGARSVIKFVLPPYRG